jgi:hypothetical protein
MRDSEKLNRQFKLSVGQNLNLVSLEYKVTPLTSAVLWGEGLDISITVHGKVNIVIPSQESAHKSGCQLVWFYMHLVWMCKASLYDSHLRVIYVM